MSKEVKISDVEAKMRKIQREQLEYYEKSIVDPSKTPTLERIKARTEDYDMFEKIIIDGVGRAHYEPEPSEKEIKKYIDMYLLELYENTGIQWVDAWDERHRENVRVMMGAYYD
jgi:hypothetical protein